ncbi:SRPBCC family protein [Amycolatopsis sp. QT-25]|uniref:SRPBCC family protein n=1 Tax=Amycolatopsis sp. QT-25 TaxID=3034022 RepID=UPI0023EE230A|nr:SRPBCC family protein [Amycolatopsis sp. QT-25]WET83198.1 SRPBCC family protein [Amycolatopsis sp. QT-25]
MEMSHAETRSVSIKASPEIVLDLVSDPHNLPLWAPGAASAVRPAGDAWLVESGGTETRMFVRVSREHGTVDLLVAEDPPQGVFTRVLPSGEGAEYQFTLLFPEGTPEQAVAQQMTIVEEELRAVRRLSEERQSSK